MVASRSTTSSTTSKRGVGRPKKDQAPPMGQEVHHHEHQEGTGASKEVPGTRRNLGGIDSPSWTLNISQHHRPSPGGEDLQGKGGLNFPKLAGGDSPSADERHRSGPPGRGDVIDWGHFNHVHCHDDIAWWPRHDVMHLHRPHGQGCHGAAARPPASGSHRGGGGPGGPPKFHHHSLQDGRAVGDGPEEEKDEATDRLQQQFLGERRGRGWQQRGISEDAGTREDPIPKVIVTGAFVTTAATAVPKYSHPPLPSPQPLILGRVHRRSRHLSPTLPRRAIAEGARSRLLPVRRRELGFLPLRRVLDVDSPGAVQIPVPLPIPNLVVGTNLLSLPPRHPIPPGSLGAMRDGPMRTYARLLFHAPRVSRRSRFWRGWPRI